MQSDGLQPHLILNRWKGKKKMKNMLPFIILLSINLIITGCATVTTKANKSIVGVWEMKEVRIAKMSQAPPVELTNKKDIYTKEGIYHDTAADSIKMTDATVRSYKFKNGNLNIYGENGQEQKSRRAKVRFIPPNKMELKTPDGIIIIFQKISDDPSEIPKLKEHIVPVKMQ